MNLKEKIQQDLKGALKKNRGLELSVLRLLTAATVNKEKEKRYKISKEKTKLGQGELEKESQLTEEELSEVVLSEVKKRREAISEFEKGQRQDLAQKEKAELEILNKYMPEQLSEKEIKKLAREVVEKIGAAGQKDMGKVMAELMPEVKGKADGGLVSKIVKELLRI